MVETEGSRQSSRPNKGQPAKRLAEENSSSSESEYEPSYKQQPKKKKQPTTNNNNKKTNSSPTTKEDSVPITNPPSANASNDINTQPSHDAHDNKSNNDDDDNINDDDDDDETSTAATVHNVTGEELFNSIATSAVGNDAFATAANIANLSPDRSTLSPTLTATLTATTAKVTASTKSTAKHTTKKKVVVSASKKARKHKRRTEWDDDIKNEEAVRNGWVKLSSDGNTIGCLLCDSVLNVRHAFSGSVYMSDKAHRESVKHRRKLSEKKYAVAREAQRIAKGKAPEKSAKLFKQSSMGGFFSKKPRPQATSSASTTSAIGGQSTNIPNTSITLRQSTPAASMPTASIITGCTGIIPLKYCKAVDSELNLSVVQKFGRLDPKSAYELKEVGKRTDLYNLYDKTCDNDPVHVGGKKQAGNRCAKCMDMWTEKSSSIKSAMKGRIANLKRAETMLLKPTLTEDDSTSMTNFTRTGDQSLNDHAGKRLKDMVKARLACECMFFY